MLPSRTLTIVGASEEATAHIRLLLRMAGTRLQHRWELRDDDEADLVIIQPHDDLATRAMQTRCQATGIPFAILCEQDDLIVHGMALRRPLKLDQLTAILNAAGAMRVETDIVTGLDADFYNTELGDMVPQGARAASTWDEPEHAITDVGLPDTPASHDFRAHRGDASDAFDVFVHGDPLIEPPPEAPLVNEHTQVEAAQGSNSARRALRHEDAATRAAASLIGVAPLDVLPISVQPVHPATPTPKPMLPSPGILPSLLREGSILSPVRISAPRLPDVVLDPKLRRFYTASQLHDLLPYADVGADMLNSVAIAGSDLARVRESRIPRSFDELDWLFALASSRGRLHPKLDPGGSYNIRQALVAAPELRAHGRIAALMTTPMPLHEVARASGARMEEVFDIVNAYHAIGRIEYIPRQRLQAAPPPQKSEKGGLFGLFSRK